MPDINILDVAVVVVLLVFAGRGLIRGFTGEVAGLVGLIFAFILARHFQSDVEPLLGKFFSDRRMTSAAAYTLVFSAVLLGSKILFALLRRFMAFTAASWVDTACGGIAGAVKGLLLCTLLFFFALRFLSGTEVVKTAATAPFFEYLGGYLRDFLPSIFPFNLPVRLPL